VLIVVEKVLRRVGEIGDRESLESRFGGRGSGVVAEVAFLSEFSNGLNGWGGFDAREVAGTEGAAARAEARYRLMVPRATPN